MGRTVIIGLDGATFELLRPAMADGYMPYLQQLMEQGAWSDLISTTPPTTPPAWSSCVTGLNPGQHGIFDFTTSPLRDPEKPLISSADVRGWKLWHHFNHFKKKTMVINVPITYPPEPTDGIMISGMMTPSETAGYTYPPDVKTRLKAICGHYIPNLDITRYDPDVDADVTRFFDDLQEMLDRRSEAVSHLMDTEPWDFMMVVFVTLDRIQHLFYKYLEPGNPQRSTPRGDRIRKRAMEEFRRVDQAAGRIMDKLLPEDTVFVVSDHGFGATDAYFNVNTWLRDHGYLKTVPREYIKKRIFHVLMTVGSHSAVRRLIPAKWEYTVRHAIRSGRSTLLSPRKDLAGVIDWQTTRAYFASIPTQGIYIHEPVTGPDYHPLRNEIRNRLDSLVVPGFGKLMDQVWFREEIYSGPETVNAPHILFKMKNYAVLGRQHLGASTWIWPRQNSPVGFHRPEGVFMARGPQIRPGQKPAARIEDVMPTVSFSAGLPVPEHLDGTILKSIFTDQFAAGTTETFFKPPDPVNRMTAGSKPYDDTGRQSVTERLRGLGYLE